VNDLYTEGTSWYSFRRQAVWVLAGFIAMVAVLRIDYHAWRRWAPVLLAVSGITLLLVLVPGIGVERNGAARWLGAGSLTFQPSELAKVAVLLFLADLLARRWHLVGDLHATLVPALVVLGGVALLIMLQPNLGTTLIVGSIVLVQLFVAGAPLLPLGAVAGGGLLGAVVLALGQAYRRERILAFLDPWSDPLDTGYQTIQAGAGMASGGVGGVGLGAGRSKWGFLPETHTDFIFAVIGEELGLIGSLVVLGLFITFGVLGLRTALRAPDPFGTLLAVGVTSWIVVQAVVNIGAVVGALPITGVPLPFVSFGGSSMVVTMAACGLLLNVARQTP
jgi:cell division protein FtsW